MSGILGAITILKKTFDKYAGEDKDKTTLSKKELANMLKTELPGAGGDKQAEVDEFFKMLDEDGDGLVNFKEYIIFVATLAMIINS
ncbi:protein S100-A5-like [Girardinichthys multiradiatus]|uniref:protein S100-A5-like n=1 Tax=Girardinichthys multiradiatus TaxID=208333 RepID=UPI001FADD07F|nr:protein S100-A5-like [Girardinichthys multiradiatus]